jgi:hypothetical protein
MTAWTSDELAKIGTADELRLAFQRAERRLRLLIADTVAT